MNLAVIGIGNPFRRDDGVGHVVAERVQKAALNDVDVVVLDGEPVRLIEAWAGYAHVVLVDAMRSGAPPGTIRSIAPLSATRDAPLSASSSHAPGVADAFLLGRAMNRMPERLTIIAIEGREFAFGASLSPAVAAAATIVAERIVAALVVGTGSRSFAARVACSSGPSALLQLDELDDRGVTRTNAKDQ